MKDAQSGFFILRVETCRSAVYNFLVKLPAHRAGCPGKEISLILWTLALPSRRGKEHMPVTVLYRHDLPEERSEEPYARVIDQEDRRE